MKFKAQKIRKGPKVLDRKNNRKRSKQGRNRRSTRPGNYNIIHIDEDENCIRRV